ncbi:MAG: ABC transporter ATP-binding protein, partial [Gammaproteobacteria bacterium]|nr:ABC transporter ATP-binding protein [Gammaproteobacteria bacterium]
MPSTPVSTEAPRQEAGALLSLTALGVTFDTPEGEVAAARDVTLAVARGECLGVLGESGAGKSQVFLAVMGLLAANGRTAGSARFAGEELLGAAPSALDRVRGSRLAMVFQDPMTSLTPHLTAGAQLLEVLARHRQLHGAAAREAAQALLERVRLSEPGRRLGQYPHELSGGMRQRVMIALALARAPELLVLDEPTTALDVTIQAQILALLLELKREREMALVLISHDLGVLAGLADRVAVMRHGRIIESGAVREVLKSPRDPYTRELVQRALRDAQTPPAVERAAAERATAEHAAAERAAAEHATAEHA